MNHTLQPQNDGDAGPCTGSAPLGFSFVHWKDKQSMAQFSDDGKASTSALPVPANCNRGPINLRLEERGLTPTLMAGAFELISAISCYGPTHRDRGDLRAAAGLLGDVLNRMRSAERAASRIGGARA